ncbi:MAG: aldose 1-epimerase [Saprospiraceae bacterium]
MITLKTNKSQVQIFPLLGGVLGDLKLYNGNKSLSILDSYQSADDAVAKAVAKSHFLLPFPNRMKDGKYTFDGKSYQFPLNDTTLQHSLHGFLETIPMEIIHQEATDIQAIVELKGSFNGLEYYPFPFDFHVKYTLTNSELSIQTKIKNTGKTRMPIGFGWHPYFKLDTETVDVLKMQFPNCQSVEIDNRMIPTGKTMDYTAFSDLNSIGNTSLDNCFILNNTNSKKVAITLQSKTTTLSVWQETDAFPYFQIYTPPHRQSIAIEPMTCNVDAFNNKNGLWILESGEEKQVEFGIEMS